MKCIECGHELKDGAIFCIRCGAMQVSMDGQPIEREEGWAEVNPASQPVNNSRPSVSGRHMADFSEPPKRNTGRIVGIVVAVLAVIAIVAFALTQCMGPATSGSGSAATTTTTTSSASSEAASTTAAEPTPTIVNEAQQQVQAPAPEPAPAAAAPAAAAPVAGSNSYVLGDSSSRYYSRDELNAMSTTDLYYARNEIFARHGRMFQRADLQEYFNSQAWYTPLYTPEQWNNLPNQLNDCELKNSELMKQVEQAKGSPYL